MYNKRVTLKKKIGEYLPKPTKNRDGIWERQHWSENEGECRNHILIFQVYNRKSKEENTIQSNNVSTTTRVLNCSDPLTKAASLCKKTIYEAHEKEKG